jgi:hypothetical protein
MSRMEHSGAFVPVIQFRGNLPGLKKEPVTLFSGRQSSIQLKNEQNCFRFRRNIFNKGLNLKSEQQIAEELLNDLSFEKKDSKNYLENISPSSKNFLILFATIASAIFSWIFTPSKGKLLSFLFSFIIGTTVYFVLQKFNPKNTWGAQKKILEKLSGVNINSNLTEFTRSLEKDYFLTSDEIRSELLSVYKKFLMFFLKNSTVELDEVNKLISLKNSFGISSQEIGKCHYECSQEIFNKNLLFLERQTSNESSQIVNKFLFLSDRLFSLDSKKGYQYEISRIKRVLNFTAFDFEENQSKISEDLYVKSIKSIQNNEKIYPNDLSEIKQLLGINKERSETISENIFRQQIGVNISNENGFDKNSIKNLKNLQKILYLSDEQFTLFVTKETSGLIKSKIEEETRNLSKILSSDEMNKILNNLQSVKENFLISDSIILSLYIEASKTLIKNTIKGILTSIKSKTISGAVEKIDSLIILSENLKELFALLNKETEKFPKKLIPEAIEEAAKNFSSNETKLICKIQIQKLMDDPVLNEKKKKSIENLRTILCISEVDGKEIYKNVVGPIFQQTIRTSIEKNQFTQENKKSIDNLVEKLNIEKNLALILKTSLYREKLQDLVATKSVFSTQDLENLDIIRIFLDLSYTNVQTIHDTICEPIFKKSIQEAMGASGIVPSNYWEGLEKLRKRLRLTESKSKDIFYNAMKERLKILFEKAIADDKKKKQPNSESTKDAGEDPTVNKGSGTSLGIEVNNPEGNELLNLVEIYFRNRVFTDKELPSNEQKKESLLGLSGRLEAQVRTKTEITFSYPVTLSGLFDKKILSDLYKQYLIECFSSKLQSEKRRLFSNLNKLGPILGLEREEIQFIHSNVGVSIYQKFLSQSLSKGYLDNSDTSFLSTIQNTLSMENSICNKLIKDSKKNFIGLEVEKIFASPKINPNNVTKIRKMANQFQINLEKDLSISNEQRSKLFRIEIDGGIGGGEIGNQSFDTILKIQESYGLENTVAKKILFDCINTRSEGHLLNAIASLRRGDDVGVLKELETMLNFGALLPIKFQNTLASSNEKSQLYSIYESNFGDSDLQKDKLKLFKTMLDL